MALQAHRDAKRKEVAKQRIDAYGVDHGLTSWMTEAAHLYVDSVESGSVRKAFLKRWKAVAEAIPWHFRKHSDIAFDDRIRDPSSSTINDAWWTMMLRSILWDLSTLPIQNPGLPMPSNLYGDTTPVWIA